MENLETRITEFEKMSALMFNFINHANQTFERIENSIRSLDIKLENLNAKIDNVAAELNAKIVSLDKRLETLEIKFDDFKTETSLDLKVITRKLDAIQIEIPKSIMLPDMKRSLKMSNV